MYYVVRMYINTPAKSLISLKVLKTLFLQFSRVLAEKNQKLFLFFYGMLAHSICILFEFVRFSFHFYEIISYLIIVRNAMIVLNTL